MRIAGGRWPPVAPGMERPLQASSRRDAWMIGVHTAPHSANLWVQLNVRSQAFE